MGRPVIAYDNLLRFSGTTLTDPGSALDATIENIKDLQPSTVWKSDVVSSPLDIDIDTGGPTPKEGNYITIINHNLASLGATVEVFAEGSFPPVTSVVGPFTPGEDTVTYREFASIGFRTFWRVRIAHASPPMGDEPFIGEISIGIKTQLPEFLSPAIDPFMKQVQTSGIRSEAGNLLAVTGQGQTHRGVIDVGPAGIARSFFTSDLDSFLDNHAYLHRPFVFVVDPDDPDFDTGRYIRLTDDGIVERKSIGGGTDSRLSFVFPFEEAFVESA